MTTPADRENERDLARRREQELKDLDTEQDHGPRPLEGLSGAHTPGTEEQDEAAAAQVHGNDEAESERRSLEQVPPDPDEKRLPEEGDGER